ETTSKRSVWLGWKWAEASVPPGTISASNLTWAPPVSEAVSMNVSRSPVTGFSTVWPAYIAFALLRFAVSFSTRRECVRRGLVRGLFVGLLGRGGLGDAALAGRQCVEAGEEKPARARARRRELRVGARGERDGAASVCEVDALAEQLPRSGPLVRPP